jgi:hypothetical protein
MILVTFAAMWKVFEKANRKGWAALIPVYNTYVMLKIAGRPGWWLILFFIPIVSLIPALVVPVDHAKRFGKWTLFGVGLIFPPVRLLSDSWIRGC